MNSYFHSARKHFPSAWHHFPFARIYFPSARNYCPFKAIFNMPMMRFNESVDIFVNDEDSTPLRHEYNTSPSPKGKQIKKKNATVKF